MTTIPVLLYHRVAGDVPGDPFAVTPAQFQAHVEVMRASGRTPMTISAIADCLSGRAELPKRPLAVTFDDGYADTPKAVSVLAEAGLPSTVYVTTGAIGCGDGITAEQVRELAHQPATVELGAHTVSHPRLDELSPSRARAEVSDSKAFLEDLIGDAVNSFAYPHGAYDERSRALVMAAGFSSAAAVKNALSHDQDDPFAIARWTVTRGITPERVEAVLEGKDVCRAWARERVRTKAYRTARRVLRAARSSS